MDDFGARLVDYGGGLDAGFGVSPGRLRGRHRDEKYLRYHQAWAVISVAVVTFLFDGRVNVWSHDRLFMGNWTWQFLWMASGTVWAVLPQSFGSFALTVGKYAACGIVLNTLGMAIAGKNPEKNLADCFFQMGFPCGVLFAAALTSSLKAAGNYELRASALGTWGPPALLAAGFLAQADPHQAQELFNEVVAVGGSGMKWHIGGENAAYGTFLVLGWTGAVLAAALVGCLYWDDWAPDRCDSSRLAWLLVGLVYAVRLTLPYEHSVAFHLHCINLFIVSVVAALRGAAPPEQLKQAVLYLPWALLALSCFTRGMSANQHEVMTDVGHRGVPGIFERLPFDFVELFFVVCYLAAAEREWADAPLDTAVHLVCTGLPWALLVFLVHPFVWRLFPPTIAAIALLAPLPVFCVGGAGAVRAEQTAAPEGYMAAAP